MPSNSASNYRLLDPKPLLQGGAGTSLENVLIAPLPNGALVSVIDQGAVYRLDKFSTEAVSAPDIIATSKGAGVPGRWVKITGTSEAGIEVLAENAADLPFELPTSGAFGVPENFTVTFGPSVAGDQFVIDAWAEITNGDENPHDLEAVLNLNGVAVLTTTFLPIAAAFTGLYSLKYVVTLLADDASPEFSAGYRADGLGPDMRSGSISVIKIPA